MLVRMINFDSSCYSRRTYARFRSSLALERFVSSPHSSERQAALRWARAWLRAVHNSSSRSDTLARIGPPVCPPEAVQIEPDETGFAREDALN